MKAHFFNVGREYLGTVEMGEPLGDYYRVPILTEMQRPLSIREAPPKIESMTYREFRAVRIYERGLVTFLIFLEV